MIAFEKITDTDGMLEIYGFTGSIIQSQVLPSGYQFISVSVKDLKPGIYLYRSYREHNKGIGNNS